MAADGPGPGPYTPLSVANWFESDDTGADASEQLLPTFLSKFDVVIKCSMK